MRLRNVITAQQWLYMEQVAGLFHGMLVGPAHRLVRVPAEPGRRERGDDVRPELLPHGYLHQGGRVVDLRRAREQRCGRDLVGRGAIPMADMRATGARRRAPASFSATPGHLSGSAM